MKVEKGKDKQQPIITPAVSPSGDATVYEYGVRLDKECIESTLEQIHDARRLYNNLVASIREIFNEMNIFILEHGGRAMQDVHARVNALNDAFAAAKAANDEDKMKQIAQERRLAWREQSVFQNEVRKKYRTEIVANFWSRIGKNSACDTYRLRSEAVADGLGWATANAVLDSALTAFKKSIARGRAPRFAAGSEKIQDALTLQFTAAGGAAASDILSGRHGELAILPANGCGRRKYGEFRFRLGAAKNATNATGTWQYHRALPEGAHIALARLVRRQIGKDSRWALQLLVKTQDSVTVSVGERKPLVAIHFGWSADITGRRVAGIADSAEPGAALILQLPPQIEEQLTSAHDLQGERDKHRDELVPQIKDMVLPDSAPELLREELLAIKCLPAQYVAIRRLHRLCGMLREGSLLPDWLEAWRKQDRMRWQATSHIARRARNARKTFYREKAIDLARRYNAIAIEKLDLAEAAKKVEETTGEKTELAKKARSGRVVAAIYELDSAIRWAAVKTGAALIDISAPTVLTCSVCGGHTVGDPDDGQLLHCQDCGADIDRKQNGAAVAWSMCNDRREDVVSDYWSTTIASRAQRDSAKRERLGKMVAGRRAARTAIEV